MATPAMTCSMRVSTNVLSTFSCYAILATLDASTFVAEYFVQPIGGFEPPVDELDIEMVSMRDGDASLTELSVTDILMEIRLVAHFCLCLTYDFIKIQ